MDGQVQSPLNGVSGWLLLLCVSLTIFIPATAVSNATTPQSRIIGIFIALWSAYAGTGLWFKASDGPSRAAAFLWFCFVANAVSFALALFSTRLMLPVAISPESSLTFAITAAAWLVYLKRSKRVRQTYSAIRA